MGKENIPLLHMIYTVVVLAAVAQVVLTAPLNPAYVYKNAVNKNGAFLFIERDFELSVPEKMKKFEELATTDALKTLFAEARPELELRFRYAHQLYNALAPSSKEFLAIQLKFQIAIQNTPGSERDKMISMTDNIIVPYGVPPILPPPQPQGPLPTVEVFPTQKVHVQPPRESIPVFPGINVPKEGIPPIQIQPTRDTRPVAPVEGPEAPVTGEQDVMPTQKIHVQPPKETGPVVPVEGPEIPVAGEVMPTMMIRVQPERELGPVAPVLEGKEPVIGEPEPKGKAPLRVQVLPAQLPEVVPVVDGNGPVQVPEGTQPPPRKIIDPFDNKPTPISVEELERIEEENRKKNSV